jgi:hypothetical protein
MARLLLDARDAATAGANGVAVFHGVRPGEHKLEGSKAQYRSRSIPVRVAERDNQPVELKLERAPGIVEVQREPANSIVTYARGSEPASVFTGARKELPEGSYTLTARAAGFQERAVTVHVVADERAMVALTLKPIRIEPPEGTIADWGNLWTRDAAEKVYRPRASGTLLFPHTPLAGTIQFTTIWERSGIIRKGRIRWVVGYHDEKNQLSFSLEPDSFQALRFVNGRKIAHERSSVEKLSAYTIRVEIARDSVVTSLWTTPPASGTWHELDRWQADGQDLTAGRFGFVVEKNKNVLLHDFRFQPRRD